MIYDKSKESAGKTLLIAILIIFIFLCQWFLFKSFVMRELAWSPYIHDDETWYLSGSYDIFDYFLKNHKLPEAVYHSASGILFIVQAGIFYLFFGASRLAALSVNFIYYILWQLSVFMALYKLTKDRSLSLVALGLALLIPGVLFFQTMTFFSYEFMAQALFWIFVSVVLGSNIFLDVKWSMTAGIVSGLLILSRYYYAAFLVPAYLFTLLFCVFLSVRHRKDFRIGFDKSDNRLRIKNIVMSGSVCVAICGPFLWKIREALYAHYILPASGVSREYDYMFWGQGAASGIAKYMFYFNSAKGFFSDSFWRMSPLLIIIVVALSIAKKYIGNDTKKTALGRAEVLDFKLSVIFIGTCLFIPYFVLSGRIIKGCQLAGVFLSSVYWITVLIIVGVYNRGASSYKNGRIPSFVALAMAVIVLLAGARFQAKFYARHAAPGSSLEVRRDMAEINKMYDDVCNLCKNKEWLSPAISVDNWVWYLYGCAWNLKSVFYERYGVVLDIQTRLGQNLYFTFNEKQAMGLVKKSDIVILGAPKGTFPVVDPEVKPRIDDFIKKEFAFLGSYPISGDLISVYYRTKQFEEEKMDEKNPERVIRRDNGEIITISASSSETGHHGYRAFDESVEPDDFWETSGYPQWLKITYSDKKAITSYTLQSGYADADRMPGRWTFQGSNDGVSWDDLDERNNETGWKAHDKRSYTVDNGSLYSCYRFYFTGGSAPWVRVYEIKMAQ